MLHASDNECAKLCNEFSCSLVYLGLTAWPSCCLWFACIGVNPELKDQAMKLNACFTSLIWQMIRIWKFKGIVASYQYELTSYERFKYADHTYGVCTVFFRERCKTFSTGTGSSDLYPRIVLDSFRRWKRLFYTLIVFLKESWDRYLSLILYVFILMMRSRLFHKVGIMQQGYLVILLNEK